MASSSDGLQELSRPGLTAPAKTMNDAGMNNEELLERARALRATGRTPKEIARALGLRPAQAAPLVRTIAAEEHAGAAEPKLAGCWVSPGWSQGLIVQGHPEWPDLEVADEEALGLVSLLVTRQVRDGRVRLCGWLVDVYCLGVKDVVGPRVMDERRTADFRSSFFAAYQARPIEAPLELAQQLVFGAVEYARSLGFEPARGFAATTDLLGPRVGPIAIRFGRDGKPFFVQGPHDNADAILRTLERSVGPGNFHYLVVQA